MGYLIAQLIIYLAIAAVIGFLMAWVLRGSRLGARIEELENELWSLRQHAGGSAPELAELKEQLAAAQAQCAHYQQQLEQAGEKVSAAQRPPTSRQ